jgi:hypothetical protein
LAVSNYVFYQRGLFIKEIKEQLGGMLIELLQFVSSIGIIGRKSTIDSGSEDAAQN